MPGFFRGKAWRFFFASVLIICGLKSSPASVYQWEWIDPSDPSKGKQKSDTLCPDGADIDFNLDSWIWNKDLTQAYMIEANIYNKYVINCIFTNADFSRANLTYTYFDYSTLTGAVFDDVQVQGVSFIGTTDKGFTQSQLQSTASYKAHDLTGVNLGSNDISGWDLQGQDLTYAGFSSANLTGTIFTNALVQSADFSDTTAKGFVFSQLQSTASYKENDLSGIALRSNDLSNWDFHGQGLQSADFRGANLSNANLSNTNLASTDFSDATLSNANFTYADIQYSFLNNVTAHGFVFEQLQSTVNYKTKDLSSLWLQNNDLSNWDFHGQKLRHTFLDSSTLANADFTNADIKYSTFNDTTSKGFTLAQLQSTLNYKAKDLSGIELNNNDLSNWDFHGQKLYNTDFNTTILTKADFHQTILKSTNFSNSTLAHTDFTDADVRGAIFKNTTLNGFTLVQLQSTASYKTKDLSGLQLQQNNLSNWDFRGQKLAATNFTDSTLTNTDYANADVREAIFNNTTEHGFTLGQLQSTASYKAKDLSGMQLSQNDLSNWDFKEQKLAGVNFSFSKLANADFTNADVRGAIFNNTVSKSFTLAQLQSTSSYKAKDLSGVGLGNNNLNGWNFSGYNLTHASFSQSYGSSTENLANAVFTDADIRWAGFYNAVANGFTQSQLQSTASYKIKDLSGIDLSYNDLSGWDFHGQNLYNGGFYSSNLTSANFSQTNLTGVHFSSECRLTNVNFSQANLTNAELLSVDFENVDFTDAQIQGVHFWCYRKHDLTQEQLKSTANYKAKDLSYIDFSGHDFSGWDFYGQKLTGIYFDTNIVNNADFTDADIRGAHFGDRCGFSYAQLQSTASYKTKDLSHLELSGIDLSGWDFHGQKLTGAYFSSNQLTNANFIDADVRKTEFMNVKSFTQSQLQSTASYKVKDLSGISVTHTDLSGWDFHEQNLTGAHFYHSTLSNANFIQANLTNASIGPAILQNANFTQANLVHADLSYADFSHAILTGANLAHASVINANFDLAVLTGANFSGVDMRGAINLDLNAVTGKNFIRPDGSIHGLDLSDGSTLTINAYQDELYYYEASFPITIKDSMNMGAGGIIQIMLMSNTTYPWKSTICFAPDIPVSLGGSLDLEFDYMNNWYAEYLAGTDFKIFDWTGVTPTGEFKVTGPYIWDLSNLYTTGTVTFLAVPEPSPFIFFISILSLFVCKIDSCKHWMTQALAFGLQMRKSRSEQHPD